MEFGKVPMEALDRMDTSLPPEPALNNQVLSGKKERTRFYIGLSRWGSKSFSGTLYPKGTKEAAFRAAYAKHFNAIEFNATHYKLYSAQHIAAFSDKVNGVLKFCPKLYQGISHFGSLQDKQFLTNSFVEGVRGFGDQLGPVFLQLSDKFGPSRKEELYAYLSSLPGDLCFFVELRHPGWFTPAQSNELFSRLRILKIGAVITDAAGRRDCCHMHLTVPKAFIRYVGNEMHPTDKPRIDAWARRIQYWKDNGLEEIYFFIHGGNEEEATPQMAKYVVQQFNDHCGAGLKPIELYGGDQPFQAHLFS